MVTNRVVVVDGVAVVVLTDGAKGNSGHLRSICGPRIASNMYANMEPRMSPTLYDRVIMLPAVSRSDEGTFEGASIIGKLPAIPLLTPNAAVKKKDMGSPDITGRARGVQQSRSRGMRRVLRPDMSVSWRLDQAYGTAARIFPIMSDVLKVNIRSTGIHVCNLQDLISDSNPGYRDSVTQ